MHLADVMIIYCLFCTIFYSFKQNLGLAVLNNNELMVKKAPVSNVAEEFSYIAENFFIIHHLAPNPYALTFLLLIPFFLSL